MTVHAKSRSVAAFLTAALCAAARPALAQQRFAILQDIARESNAPAWRQDNWLDTTFLASWQQAHLAYTFGSFDAGAEAGGFLRDRRGSTYGLTLRRRSGGRVENTAAEFDTQQRVARLVLGGALRLFWPDHPEGDNLSFVPSAHAEVYYRDDSFVALTVTRDPRPGTGITFRLANRLGTQRHHADVALAPRTDGVLGWSLMGRWDWFLAGFGREPDYDFTEIDRQTFFFGFQYDLRP